MNKKLIQQQQMSNSGGSDPNPAIWGADPSAFYVCTVVGNDLIEHRYNAVTSTQNYSIVDDYLYLSSNNTGLIAPRLNDFNYVWPEPTEATESLWILLSSNINTVCVAYMGEISVTLGWRPGDDGVLGWISSMWYMIPYTRLEYQEFDVRTIDDLPVSLYNVGWHHIGVRVHSHMTLEMWIDGVKWGQVSKGLGTNTIMEGINSYVLKSSNTDDYKETRATGMSMFSRCLSEEEFIQMANDTRPAAALPLIV